MLAHSQQCDTEESRRTFAVEGALFSSALSLVVVLVAHFRRHRDAFPSRLGDVLGHAHPPGDNVIQERHVVALFLTPLNPSTS